MKIQIKQGDIIITNEACKVVINDTVDVLKKEEKVLSIVNPGEYESNGVMVQAISQNEKRDVHFFSLDIEGINTVFLDLSKGIPSQRQAEQVGVNDILILKISDSFEKVREIIDLFDPEFLLPITQNHSEIENLAKKMGILIPEKVSTFAINVDQLDELEDEGALQLIVLE